MTDDEYDMKMYKIHESYTAEDIGEIDGEENTVFWHPSIDGTRIESCVNLDIQYPYFRYIRSKADDEYGKICRIRLDKPEYIIHKGDIILTKQERDKLIQILNSKRFWSPLPNSQSVWRCLLDSNRCGYQWYNKSTIDLDYKMPDYSLLPTSD